MFRTCLFFFFFALIGAISAQNTGTSAPLIEWYTWEEAVALNKKAPRKIMVDVYTDWCGWCKVMDKKTFTDSTLATFINNNFYAVKLNAEQKGDIQFQGQNFKFVESGNGRGVHTLAYALLDGQMGYPAFVYLNEKFERIMISPGYKEPPAMMKELHFALDEVYNRMKWEEYNRTNE